MVNLVPWGLENSLSTTWELVTEGQGAGMLQASTLKTASIVNRQGISLLPAVGDQAPVQYFNNASSVPSTTPPNSSIIFGVLDLSG